MSKISTPNQQILLLESRLSQVSSSEEKLKIISEYSREISEQQKYKAAEDLEGKYRLSLASHIKWLFMITNIFVALCISIFIVVDIYNIGNEKYHPLVNANIMLALIAGTVAQTGVVFGVLANYVFGSLSKEKSRSEKH